MTAFQFMGVSFTAAAIGFAAALLWQKGRGHAAAPGPRPQSDPAPQEAEQARAQLDRLFAFMTALHDCGVSPNGRLPREEFSQTLVEAASALLDAENVLWLETDRTTLDLTAKAGRGVAPGILASLRIHPGEGLLGSAAQSRRIVVVYDKDALISPLPKEQFLTAPYVGLPFLTPSHLVGLLVMWKPRRGLFGSATTRLAELLASQAGRTLENLDLYENQQRFQDEMVQSLARALDTKDSGTHKHSDRTRALVRAMGQDIHLPEQLIQQVEHGALLHDVGKIGIDEAILRKPGKLTTEEYTAMKKHPEIGHRILSPVVFLKPVAPIVLYHQEWYNGQGYPEGLAGEEIPLGARMVAVIDAWDAMTSDRPYRKAMQKSAAIAELRRQAGTQFDPKLVDSFLRVIDRLEREGVPTTEQKPEEAVTPSA